MKHDVHVYATVRIKVWNVEAGSHQEAMKKAEETVAPRLCEMFPDRTSAMTERPESELTIESGGYAEEITGFMVDEIRDADDILAQYYDTTYERGSDDE